MCCFSDTRIAIRILDEFRCHLLLLTARSWFVRNFQNFCMKNQITTWLILQEFLVEFRSEIQSGMKQISTNLCKLAQILLTYDCCWCFRSRRFDKVGIRSCRINWWVCKDWNDWILSRMILQKSWIFTNFQTHQNAFWKIPGQNLFWKLVV